MADAKKINIGGQVLNIKDEYARQHLEEKANQTDVYGSEEYSATTSYSVDDMCIYDGKLWKCLVACSGQTPSESTYWTRISLKSIDRPIKTKDYSVNSGSNGSIPLALYSTKVVPLFARIVSGNARDIHIWTNSDGLIYATIYAWNDATTLLKNTDVSFRLFYFEY